MTAYRWSDYDGREDAEDEQRAWSADAERDERAFLSRLRAELLSKGANE